MIKEFKCGVFPFYITVIAFESEKKANKFLKKCDYNLTIVRRDTDRDVLTYLQDGSAVVDFTVDLGAVKNMNLIAHEATHVANQILKTIGASFDIDNDEFYAYLVGWSAECIAETLYSEEDE